MKKLIPIVLAVTTLSGCAVAVVGGVAAGAAAGYVWINGKMVDTMKAPLPKVHQATVKAAEDLDLVAIDSAVDKLKGKVSAQMSDGTRVWIQLKAVDLESTAVRVRVGTLGDKALSQLILRHIREHL
jgi:hypothetical protein